MKISYNWIKDYLECDLAPEAVAEALTAKANTRPNAISKDSILFFISQTSFSGIWGSANR